MMINLLLFLILCGTIILTIWFFKKYSIARVQGFSMHPTLKNRELVFVKKRYVLRLNGIYAFKDPNDLICVKRLTKLIVGSFGDVNCFFTGDNIEDSIDSRSYGFIRSSSVVGEVLKNLGGK